MNATEAKTKIYPCRNEREEKSRFRNERLFGSLGLLSTLARVCDGACQRDGKIEARSFKLALFGTCTTEFRQRYRGLSKQNWISPRRVSASFLNDRVKPNLERSDSRETRGPVNTLVRP